MVSPQSADTSEWQEIIRRPKLLFLAWCFPPARSIAAVRAWNVAKYLVRLGWDVTVVTPDPSLRRYVDDPEKVLAQLQDEGIRCIWTDHRWRCLSPYHLKCWNNGLGWVAGGVCRKIARHFNFDSEVGWIKAAEQCCAKLRSADVDVILASGPPFAAFSLAKRLADRLGRPYVLDYRDTWTVDPHSDRPARLSTIRKEAGLVAASRSVTVVSRSWGSLLDRHYGLGAKLHIVTNGYDNEELTRVKAHTFGHFAIVYAGTFYPPKRVISPIMAGLKLLETTDTCDVQDWYFHYFGPHEDHVRSEASRFGVSQRVVFHGNVPRSEVLSALRGAGLAVVITSILEGASPEDEGIVPGKLFEIIGQGTPILLIAPPSGDIHHIVETTGLARTFTGNDIDGIAEFIRSAMRGQVPERKCPQAYSWANIVKKFDAVLRDVSAHRMPVCLP